MGARIDVEAQRERVAAVGRVELAPVTGAVADRCLGVIHPHHRGDAAEALEGSYTSVNPHLVAETVSGDTAALPPHLHW